MPKAFLMSGKRKKELGVMFAEEDMCDDTDTCSGDSSDDSGVPESLQSSEVSHVSPEQISREVNQLHLSFLSPQKSAFAAVPRFSAIHPADRLTSPGMCPRVPFPVPALRAHSKLDHEQTTSGWSLYSPPAFPVSLPSLPSLCAKTLPDYQTACSNVDTSIPFTTYLMNLTQFLHKSSAKSADDIPSTSRESEECAPRANNNNVTNVEDREFHRKDLSHGFQTLSHHLSTSSPLRQQLTLQPTLASYGSKLYAKPQTNLPLGGALTPGIGALHPAFLQLGGTHHRRQTADKPPPLKKYKCDTCGKAFSRSNTLVTHKRIHTGDKPFKCDQCGRAFRQPGNLTRHRLTHTTFKPYVCPTCNKAFNRASNLHTHMRTHTNYKPFVCPYCGKGFHQKIDMKIHCYTHTGQRPHKCDFCGKGFTLSSTLNAHRRTHMHDDAVRTPEVQCVSCHVCRADFLHHSDLTTHIMTSHSHQTRNRQIPV